MNLENLRVTFVLGRLGLGGAERQALHLAHFLAAGGASVEVCALGHPGRAIDVCEAYGIPWRLMPVEWPRSRLGRLRSLLSVARALRRHHPDVLLPYTMWPNVLCGVTWRLCGARLSIWNQRDEGRDFTGRKIERLSARLTPLFVSNSQHGAQYVVRQFGVDPTRMHVIRNGVALPVPERSRSDWRRALGLSQDVVLACMVANLHSYKDHATLLWAWRSVVDRSRDSNTPVLLLAGRFDDTDALLKAQAYDLELGKSVRFLGAVDDVAGLLDAVDIGVHSSRFEGCPNGALECMAAGLPIVATDIPGIREAVGPRGEGQLAAPGDAEAMAARILDLVHAPGLRQQLGRENKRRIDVEFTVDQMCRNTVAVILQGLSGGPSRQALQPRPARALE